MPPKRLFAKKAASWLVAALGIIVGFSGLTISGLRWIPDPKTDAYWLRPWIQTAGIGLLGLMFLTASIFALRRRRRAGLVFLVFGPIVAFCFAFERVGFYKPDAQGNDLFYTPFLSTALSMSLVFFVPFVIPLFVIRNRRRALYLFLILATAVSLMFAFSPWTASLLPRLAGLSALFVLFGLFWLGTDKLGWPSLIATRPRSLQRRIANALALCAVVAIVDIAATFALSAWSSSTWLPDCGGGGLFAQPKYPDHAVFTARLILVGRTSETIFPAGMVGDWDVGVVQDRFWGVHSWLHLVLLTNHIFWKHQTYFIDGRRADGALTRFLPIVRAGRCGARSRPLIDAALELRVLHEKLPVGGARIIGYVRKPEPFTQGLTPPVPHRPFAGAKITVTGPSGKTVAVADRDGIYEIDGLAPDDYTLALELPDTQIVPERKLTKEELIRNKLVEAGFQVDWNGTIDGVVKDATGRPAPVWLQLQNADGTSVGPGIQGLGHSSNDGSFGFGELTAGRYVLMVNPDGPSKEWPYGPLYYPSAVRAADAHIFEIAEGQHVRNVVFTIGPPLPRRTVHVRVTWPNKQAVKGASIHVDYEHTRDYDDARGIMEAETTDKNGEADVSVFGNSRVRIYASQAVDIVVTRPWFSPAYSQPVEFQADKTPERLNFVLPFLKPLHSR